MSNLATAMEIQQGMSEVVFSTEVMIYAAQIARLSDNNPEVIDLLMKYTAELSAGVATKIVQIVMPKSEFKTMMEDLREMEMLGDSIE